MITQQKSRNSTVFPPTLFCREEEGDMFAVSQSVSETAAEIACKLIFPLCPCLSSEDGKITISQVELPASIYSSNWLFPLTYYSDSGLLVAASYTVLLRTQVASDAIPTAVCTLLYFSKLAYTSITRNSGHEPLNFFSCSRYHVNFYHWITWSWSVFIACKTDDNNLLICHSLSLSSYQHKHHLETALSLLLSINLGTVDIITTFLYCLRQQLWEFGDYPCYHTQDGASLPVSAH